MNNEWFKDLKPEDVFQMVTIMPKKKIKVSAYLEDKDGERILVSEISENLISFLTDEMASIELTPVNGQIFPLAASFMTSIVPRYIGMEVGAIMLQATSFRQTMLTLTMASMLLMQYIEQHSLKIVTEVTDLTDDEVQAFISRSTEMEDRMNNALQNMIDPGSTDD